MNLVAGAVGRNQCSLAVTTSVGLERSPATTQLVWSNYGMTQSPAHLPLPSLSSLTMNLHFLPLLPAKFCQQQVHLPSHTSQVASAILPWLVTSLLSLLLATKYSFGQVSLTLKISVAGHTILSLLRSTVLSQMHRIIA